MDKMPDFDDKDLVIICVTLITMGAILAAAFGKLTPEVVSLAQTAYSGLFGVAVGRAMSKD